MAEVIEIAKFEILGGKTVSIRKMGLNWKHVRKYFYDEIVHFLAMLSIECLRYHQNKNEYQIIPEEGLSKSKKIYIDLFLSEDESERYIPIKDGVVMDFKVKFFYIGDKKNKPSKVSISKLIFFDRRVSEQTN